MIKKALVITLTSCFFIQYISATLVTGDPNASAGNTFSFDIGHAKLVATESEQTRLWLAAGQTTTGDTQKYALSFVQRISAEPLVNPITGLLNTPTVTAMANPENATVYTYNSGTDKVTSSNVANPIYGAQFNLFDISGNKPVFTLGAAPNNNIYMTHNIERYETPIEGKSNVTELLLHDLGAGEQAAALSTFGNDIFVAHAPGAFGTATSKIVKLTSNNKLQTNGSLPYLEKLTEATIDINTEALRGGGNPLASFGPGITFHHFAGTTYAGLTTTADNGGSDKAAGIMIVRTTLTGTTLNFVFEKITDDTVISDTTATAISAPDNGTINITKIAGMTTSTSLNYLIVARDTGAGTGPQSIYAVPLVSQTGENYGKIADITASNTNPNNSFYLNPNRFASRTLATPLTDPAQITPTNPTYQEQLEVGKGVPALAAGSDIKDMYAVGDTVYIVIDSTYDGANTTQPGTFYSQAIFNANGTIASWTPWARALGSDEPMLYSNVSPTSTINFYVSDSAGGTSFRKVVQSQWHVNHNLSSFLKEAHSPKGINPEKTGETVGGGIQGLCNFSQNNPAVSNASFLITTGFNQVTVAQTGDVIGGDFKVLSPVATQSYNDINSSNALITAELAKNGNDYWFFVGGATGVQALTNATGVTKAGTAFTDITDFDSTGKSWKKVGNYTFVKKLIADNTTYLYILTPTKLDRIELLPGKFIDNPTTSLDPITVLESSSLSENTYLLDIIIDTNFAIIGTTNGMYSLNTNTGVVTSIPVPDGLPAVSQLLTVSNNNEAQRNFTDKSNLYVLNNSFGTQEARLNRFSISGTTITPFDDSLLGTDLNTAPKGVPSSFITFNNYISNYFTNGSTNLASNYFLGTTQPSNVISPSILQIFAGVSNGKSSTHVIHPILSTPVSTRFLTGVDNFLGVTCESTSGALVAAGNLEARVNS